MDDSLAHATWDLVGKRFKGHRIVHDSPSCRSTDGRDTFAVETLIGADGLAMMLGWIQSGQHNVKGVVELIRRIHISRFELVAPWFAERYLPLRPPRDPRSFAIFQEQLEDMIQMLQSEGWPQPRKPGPFLRPGAHYAIQKVQRSRSALK